MKNKLILIITITFFIFLIIYREHDGNYIAVYLDNVESTTIPDRNSNYMVDKVVCDNDAIGTWDNDKWGLLITNLSKKSNCKMYFRSKKDITIIYDNNYVKNNIFEKIYNTTDIHRNAIVSSATKYEIIEKDGAKNFIFTSGSGEIAEGGSSGFYITLNDERLDSSKTFTITYEAKGNTEFNAFIGSEQIPLLGTIKIQKNYKKYIYTFIPRADSYAAFIFYGWLAKEEERTLKVRNIALQEGEYDNYSTISLKENDVLGKTLPAPTRDNYTFLGWYTEPIDGDKISSNTIVTDNVTYYAHWQYNK